MRSALLLMALAVGPGATDSTGTATVEVIDAAQADSHFTARGALVQLVQLDGGAVVATE